MQLDEELLKSTAWLEEQARLRLVEGDLFKYANPVIPIRTKGRSYGALSERVVADGVLLPDLNMTDRQAEFVPPYLFMAILDDGDELWDLSVSCAALACMHTALRAGIKQIAMPVLECKGELTFIAAAERGILFALIAESDEWQFPGHTFVTGEHVHGTR